LKSLLQPVKSILLLTGFFIAVNFTLGCSQEQSGVSITGYTMGTSYNIKISNHVAEEDLEQLRADIKIELADINQTFSTYITDSEVSLFNESNTTEWQPASTEFIYVLSSAVDISLQTQGLYDVTVGPLVNLWGFGPSFNEDDIPARSAIKVALERTGYQKVLIDAGKQLIKKTTEDVYLDFSSIAKGYGVDRLAILLDKWGYTDYMIEIGGEIRVQGVNKKGVAWLIAIEKPDSTQRDIQKILSLDDISLATSGDYRNYFEKEGIRYSHTINPLTGWPVRHQLVSVTVLADSSMKADSWATALLAIGVEKGYDLAIKNQLSVLFISNNQDELVEKITPSFTKYIKEQQ